MARLEKLDPQSPTTREINFAGDFSSITNMDDAMAVIAGLTAQLAQKDIINGNLLLENGMLRMEHGRIAGVELNGRLPETLDALAKSQEAVTELTAQIATTRSLLTASETARIAAESRAKMAESESRTNPLTQLTNRKGLTEAFPAETSRMARGESVGSVVLMMDLGGFKTTNDVHGHDAGDECLKRVASILKQSVRPTDLATRLGGDEFVVVLTNTTKQDASKHIHEIYNRLNNATIEYNGATIPIRSSMGVAECGANQSFSDVMHEADERMYRLKRMLKRWNGQDSSPRV